MLRKHSVRLSLLLVIVSLLVGAGSSRAGDGDRVGKPVKFLSATAVPSTPRNNTGGKMFVFDISWVDEETQLYYLADRSNAVVDVVNARTGAFVKQITGSSTTQPTGFTGFTGSNDTSGPNGVVVANPFLFVTDAPSRVVSIDLRTNPPHVISDVRTGGDDGNRADEMAFDPENGLLLAVNNADSPPFATLIKVDPKTGQLTQPKNVEGVDRITFKDATNGAEQPVWDPRTGRFYISIPEVNGPGGTGPDGAVAKINPATARVEQEFPVKFCQPAGLTVFGAHQDLLLGCSVIFDTANQPWSSADPNTAAARQIIMDARSGDIDADVAGVGGSDEVWFNHGDGRYYTASRDNPSGPALGVIDAETQTLVQVVPTFNTSFTFTPPSPGKNKTVRATAHSVAVDSHNNHALVPLPANNVFPNCLNGCIAIYGTE